MEGLESALIQTQVSFELPKHRILFSCLIRLMTDFEANRPTLNYVSAQDFEGDSSEF